MKKKSLYVYIINFYFVQVYGDTFGMTQDAEKHEEDKLDLKKEKKIKKV